MAPWLMIGLAFSVPFSGKPTHLSCTFDQAAQVPPIAVTIDGSHRAVTLATPSTGRVERQRATLSGATISFDSPLQYGSITYAIDRSDLSIVRAVGGPTAPPVIARGRCRIEAAPTLAF